MREYGIDDVATQVLNGFFDNPRSLRDQKNSLLIVDCGSSAIPNSGRVILLDSRHDPITLYEGISNSVSQDGHILGVSSATLNDSGILAVLGSETWTLSPLRGPNQLVQIDRDGLVSTVFDFQHYESRYDPDSRGIDSNATDLSVYDEKSWVCDSGGNWVALLNKFGKPELVVPFDDQDGMDAVPTAIMAESSESALVSLLRWSKSSENSGAIVRVTTSGAIEEVVTGLDYPVSFRLHNDNIVILEYGNDQTARNGKILIASIDQDSRGYVEISAVTGLNNPTGIEVTPDGTIYFTCIQVTGGGAPETGELWMAQGLL